MKPLPKQNIVDNDAYYNYPKEEGFQLYFAGGYVRQSEEYLMEHNCNRLVSQYWSRSIIKGWIRGRQEQNKHGRLFIDSGAFTAHTKGFDLDIDEYIQYVNGIDDEVHLFAQVDTIPGTFGVKRTNEDIKLAPKLTWENYLYMWDRVISPHKLMPVFHQEEEYKWLENMLEWRDKYGRPIPYIGLAPSKDKSVAIKEAYIEDCFRIIRNSSNPNIKTHALGMTSLDILERHPFTSADSTSWILSASFGSIHSAWGNIPVSDRVDVGKDHYLNMSDNAQKDLEEYVRSKGFELDVLKEDYASRIQYNIQFLMDWCRAYKHKPVLLRSKSLIRR